MDMMTHLVFEDFFNEVDKGGLALPLSCLGDERLIDDVIKEHLCGLDPIEAISYSAFWNMIVQHCDSDESASLGRKELEAVGFGKNIPDNKVFLHRDCLLNLMARIIVDDNSGTIQITGGSDRRGTRKYYKSLLLVNSKTNRITGNTLQTLLKDYFIRDYPLPYATNATSTIYKHRLQRYWYIYSKILHGMNCHEREMVFKGIHALEKESGLSLREHYSVLAGVLSWFLILPVEKRKGKIGGAASLGFNYRNINSFYIRKNNFPDTDRLMRLIEYLARDKNCLQKHFTKNRRDTVNGFYRNFQDFFDRPIFKIDQNNFCILDLKFFVESLCSGFLWRIADLASIQNILPDLKARYGQLLEKYFVFLLEQIFGQGRVSRTPGEGADAIVETDKCLFLFEFTTEYYRFASLYNTAVVSFIKDMKRLLFNQGKNDPDGREKKDKGKFLKLNEYLNASGKQEKAIIPILVTENYLGDYDLLNQFDNILDQEIKKCGLTSIQKHKPLILCLDDLEILWALTEEDRAVDELCKYLEAWESANKGEFLYNFSSFISSQDGAVIRNENYLTFFDYSKFWDDLAK